MRTTLDIDAPVLMRVKALQKRTSKSLGRVVSELLAESLQHHREHSDKGHCSFHWNARPMQAKVDLRDRDALYDVMDEDKG